MKTLLSFLSLFLLSSVMASPVPIFPTGNTSAPNSTYTVNLQDVPPFFSSATLSVAGDFVMDPLGGIFFHRGASDPALTPGTLTTSVQFYLTDLLNPPNTGYKNGAVSGDDNWVHMRYGKGTGTTADDDVAWVQFDLTTTTASVVKYVYDAASPGQAITLPQAVSAIPEPSVLTGIVFGALALGAFRRYVKRRP